MIYDTPFRHTALDAELQDTIKFKRVSEKTGQFHTEIPMLLACGVCGGIRGIYANGTENLDRELAIKVALFQHGYQVAQWEASGMNWGNRVHFPTKCTCTCEHEWDETASPRMFEHHLTCTKCGHKLVTDSSD